MSEAAGLISSWSGHLYALATADGRVKTYDTGSIQAAALPNGNLADGVQSLAWLDGSEAKARSGNPTSTSGLAVGLASGLVRAYDTATGTVRWQAQGCSDGAASCLAVAGAHGLMCSGRDGHVVCLDPGSGAMRKRFRGSKHAVTGAAVSPDGSKLLLGSSTLVLLDIGEATRIYKLSGHTTTVRAIAFAPSGLHALSCAGAERSVAVWNTSGSKKARKLGGVAVATLEVDDPAVAVAACTASGPGDADGAFYAAAVTEAGEALVWLCTPEGEAAVVAALAARVRVGSGGGGGGGAAAGGIFAATLEAAGEGATLLVARGNSAKPTFDRVPIARPAPGAPQRPAPIELAPSAAGLLLCSGGDAQAAQQTPQRQDEQQHGAAGRARSAGAAGGGAAGSGTGPSRDVEMLGPANDGMLVRLRAPKKRPQPEDAAADDDEEGSAGSGSSSDEPGSDDDGEDGSGGGPTLGERVAELERRQQEEAGPSGAAADEAAGAALLQGPIKADSLAVLLTQALRSGDRGLLERCLGLSDARVVRNSVRRLLPMDAASLLRACVERLQSRPARGQQLAGWIRAVLLHHAAYLMAAPGAQPVLTSLYQTIEARLAMQRALLSLAGRLDLLLAQVGPRQGAGGDDDGSAGGPSAPRVVYEESGSDDVGAEVEVEDVFAPRPLDSDDDSEEGEEGEEGDLLGGAMGDDDEDEEGEEEEGEEEEDDEAGGGSGSAGVEEDDNED